MPDQLVQVEVNPLLTVFTPTDLLNTAKAAVMSMQDYPSVIRSISQSAISDTGRGNAKAQALFIKHFEWLMDKMAEKYKVHPVDLSQVIDTMKLDEKEKIAEAIDQWLTLKFADMTVADLDHLIARATDARAEKLSPRVSAPA